jgi:hypothetical protein
MKQSKCSVCKKELNIRLMPDFSSSGMWCSNCGVEISNSLADIVPHGLIDLIDGWVALWDCLCMTDPERINKDAFDEDLRRMGIELQKQLSVYVPCWFDEKNSKIYFI